MRTPDAWRASRPGSFGCGSGTEGRQLLLPPLASSCRRTDGRGRVLLEVADNGPGIVPDALPRVFIPFFTTKPDGTGIGLSLCRQIMRLHRGSITVRCEAERETVFALGF